MIASKCLILSSTEKICLNDIGNGYNREFVKNGAKFIDYEDAYLKFGSKKVYEFILKNIDENDIEVLIYQADSTDFRFSLEFFLLLQKKVFVVMMLGDAEYYFDSRDVYYAQCADLVVVYNYSLRYRFEHYGINAISFYSSYDKNKYFKINSVKKDIEISFVGQITNYEDRREYIDYIVTNGMPIEIFGQGSKNGQVALGQMVNIFNKTKVNINFTGITTKNVLRKRLNIDCRLKQMKGRMTEIALCCGFVLSEYVPGINEVFCIDKEIAVFHAKKDLLEKIKYYLEHEDERESIAERGYIRALRDYEISAAIPKLINKIEDFRKIKVKRLQEVYIDSHFIRNYTTFRVKMIVKFLRLRKWKLLCEELSVILKNRRLNIIKALIIFISGVAPFLKTCYLRVSNAIKH
ncbi:MAG: glycosyltransferase [Elusimicrobia bacterium]|nr:glycosyltransferase [Elusimicrobiota bacterium]